MENERDIQAHILSPCLPPTEIDRTRERECEKPFYSFVSAGMLTFVMVDCNTDIRIVFLISGRKASHRPLLIGELHHSKVIFQRLTFSHFGFYFLPSIRDLLNPKQSVQTWKNNQEFSSSALTFSPSLSSTDVFHIAFWISMARDENVCVEYSRCALRFRTPSNHTWLQISAEMIIQTNIIATVHGSEWLIAHSISSYWYQTVRNECWS